MTLAKCLLKLTLFLLLIMICIPSLAATNVDLSLESGFYPDEIILEITCEKKNSVIYYTLDGSCPMEKGIVYEAPLTLSSTIGKHDPLSQITRINPDEDFIPLGDFPSAHVVRARALLANGKWSDESCGTFFIGYNREALYGNLPIISLMMDADDLFNYETGIYTMGRYYDEWRAENPNEPEGWRARANYSNSGREWERPVMVDFLMDNGDVFCQNMGIRIKGGASRSASQKSLRLIARDEYGAKNIKYPLFPDNIREADGKQVTKYKSVTLRNGGNDKDHARIRDPFIQLMAEGLHVDVSATRPVIAFINGEYWGLYTFHEELNDNYVQHHYDIDNENVVTFKKNKVDEGEEEDAALYWNMFSYIVEHDMADAAHYSAACEMLDMQSFADYLALNIYICNQDSFFENNNWMMWRARVPQPDVSPYADGKWRMMVYDTDFSSGVYTEGKNFPVNNLRAVLKETSLEEDHPARMVHSLLKNPEFEALLVNALCDMRNLFFIQGKMLTTLGQMRREYSPYLVDTFRRFGPSWIAAWDPENHIKTHMNHINTFFKGRSEKFLNQVKDFFHLSGKATITVKCSNSNLGTAYINNRPYPINRNLSVKYFPEYPITITAEPMEGARFVEWTVNNANASVADAASPTTELTFSGTCIVTAVFEPIE
ncbi:MAG: spore coat protein CotH [Clostridiales bacterium]|nr:spore coat protein CotH [Clostridiales bacterium]